jgi:hypothetical protein
MRVVARIFDEETLLHTHDISLPSPSLSLILPFTLSSGMEAMRSMTAAALPWVSTFTTTGNCTT